MQKVGPKNRWRLLNVWIPMVFLLSFSVYPVLGHCRLNLVPTPILSCCIMLCDDSVVISWISKASDSHWITTSLFDVKIRCLPEFDRYVQSIGIWRNVTESSLVNNTIGWIQDHDGNVLQFFSAKASLLPTSGKIIVCCFLGWDQWSVFIVDACTCYVAPC